MLIFVVLFRSNVRSPERSLHLSKGACDVEGCRNHVHVVDGYVADLKMRGRSVRLVLHPGMSKSTAEVGPMTFKVSEPSAEHLRGLTSGLGAVLTGRRTFDVAQGWGGNHAWDQHSYLPTHPAGWPRPNSTVHFVTDGVESAVNQAKTAAAGKSVGHGADTIQQCLNAGCSTKIHVDIVAFCLAPEFASSTASPARRSSLQPDGDPGSALHTCATGTRGIDARPPW